MSIPKRRFAVSVEFGLLKPPRHVPCSVCHHVRERVPFILRSARYATGRTVVERICPYCVFEWEAASIIVKAYPRAYKIYRDGMYHRVKLIPQLALFTENGAPHEI